MLSIGNWTPIPNPCSKWRNLQSGRSYSVTPVVCSFALKCNECHHLLCCHDDATSLYVSCVYRCPFSLKNRRGEVRGLAFRCDCRVEELRERKKDYILTRNTRSVEAFLGQVVDEGEPVEVVLTSGYLDRASAAFSFHNVAQGPIAALIALKYDGRKGRGTRRNGCGQITRNSLKLVVPSLWKLMPRVDLSLPVGAEYPHIHSFRTHSRNLVTGIRKPPPLGGTCSPHYFCNLFRTTLKISYLRLAFYINHSTPYIVPLIVIFFSVPFRFLKIKLQKWRKPDINLARMRTNNNKRSVG
uniref:Uncharacterized protein n=1 Tax=Heterorhabditis bacteriophora TaxID=37862 RepID=A0A1I7WGN6_HETBA